MGELSENVRDLVLDTFLRDYNAHYGSAYGFTRQVNPIASEDASIDYLFDDPSRPPLKVQMTRVYMPVKAPHEDEPRSLHAKLHDPEDRKRPGIMWGSFGGYAARAVKEKSERLGPSAADLVLLVFCDLRRFDPELDLPDMVGTLSYSSPILFREVWVMWEFEDMRGKAIPVWPSPPRA